MKVYYLEIVSPDVETACRAYEAAHGVTFGEPDDPLGGERTATLADGSLVGVRGPLRPSEAPVVRPYWLVEDIEAALAAVVAQGGEVAVEPLELPGKGTFAIYVQGSTEHGL